MNLKKNARRINTLLILMRFSAMYGLRKMKVNSTEIFEYIYRFGFCHNLRS